MSASLFDRGGVFGLADKGQRDMQVLRGHIAAPHVGFLELVHGAGYSLLHIIGKHDRNKKSHVGSLLLSIASPVPAISSLSVRIRALQGSAHEC